MAQVHSEQAPIVLETSLSNTQISSCLQTTAQKIAETASKAIGIKTCLPEAEIQQIPHSAVPLAPSAKETQSINPERIAEVKGRLQKIYKSSSASSYFSCYPELMKAIKLNDRAKIQQLFESVTDPESRNEMALACTTQAILYNKPDLLKLLKDCHVTLTHFEVHPAITAIQFNKPEMLTLLKELEVDFDAPDRSGLTPAAFAIVHNKLSILPLLKELKANLNAFDANGMTPSITASLANNKDALEALQQLGTDCQLAREYTFQKSLASIWGLRGTVPFHWKGNTLQIPLEGLSEPFQRVQMENMVERFVKQSNVHSLQQDEVEILLDALHHHTSAELYQKITEGKPIFLIRALQYPKHMIGLVLNKNTIMICDRGGVCPNCGVDISSFNLSNLQECHIHLLQHMKEIGDLFRFLKIFDAHTITTIPQKQQKVGNCSWTSAESALLALLYVILEKRIPDPEERKEEAKKIYKEFTTFVRLEIVQEYLSTSESPNPEVLCLLQEKLEDNTHMTIQQKEALYKDINKTLPTTNTQNSIHPISQ